MARMCCDKCKLSSNIVINQFSAFNASICDDCLAIIPENLLDLMHTRDYNNFFLNYNQWLNELNITYRR